MKNSERHDPEKDVGMTHAPPEGGESSQNGLMAASAPMSGHPLDGADSGMTRRAPTLMLEASRGRQGDWNTTPGHSREAQAQAEPEREVAAYRARMLAKVGDDPNRAINFTDAELADFIAHAKGLGFGQADIEAILAVKVRKPQTKAIILKLVADCLAKKREDKRIRFKEGWDFMRAYGEAQNAMLRGNALKPEAYLDADYLESHQQAFIGTASYLLPGKYFDLYVNPQKTDKINLGYLGALYVSSSSEIDRVLYEANGDIAKVESALGINEGDWQGLGGLWRVNIMQPESKGLRIPNGFEESANAYWTPGGLTSGGTQEVVLDEVPRIQENHTFQKVID